MPSTELSGEEGEEVEETGEVGASKAEHQSYFYLVFCFGKEAGQLDTVQWTVNNVFGGPLGLLTSSFAA